MHVTCTSSPVTVGSSHVPVRIIDLPGHDPSHASTSSLPDLGELPSVATSSASTSASALNWVAAGFDMAAVHKDVACSLSVFELMAGNLGRGADRSCPHFARIFGRGSVR